MSCLLSKKLNYGAVACSSIMGLGIACYAIKHLFEDNFLNYMYCLINSAMKTEEDVLDYTLNNTCNSSQVLKYKPEDLKPYLAATLWLQAIIGSGLVITGSVAFVSLWRNSARGLVPWLVTMLAWTVAQVFICCALYHFEFVQYGHIVLFVLLLSVVCLLGVGYHWRQMTSRQGHYKLPDNTQDFGDRDEPECEGVTMRDFRNHHARPMSAEAS